MNEGASRPPRQPIHRIVLVRCGNLEDTSYMPDFSGHQDPGLSALGLRQTDAIAERIAPI